jgi:hypothetical protein
MKNIYSIALVASAMALMPHTMRAQQTPPLPPDNWIFDNFTTAAGKVPAVTGVHNLTMPATGTSSEIIGGSRYISLDAASNPYLQPILVQVRPSASTTDPSSFLWSLGYGASARIDLIYGTSSGPMNLDLTGYDRLRVDFGGLTGPLNFNIVVEQGSNDNIAGACSINLGASGANSEAAPFTVDFPLSAFTANSGGPVQWSDIIAIDLVFQGGSDLAITKFLAIPIASTEPMSQNVCGATTPPA